MRSGVGRLTGCFRIMLQWTGFPLYSSRHSNAFHTQGQTDWPTRETYYNHPQWMYFFRFWLAKTNRSHTDTLFHTVSFTWSGNTNQVGKYTGNRNNQLYLWRILLRDESDSSSGKSADLHVQPSISKGVWQAPITSWGWTYPAHCLFLAKIKERHEEVFGYQYMSNFSVSWNEIKRWTMFSLCQLVAQEGPKRCNFQKNEW